MRMNEEERYINIQREREMERERYRKIAGEVW